jgi:putative tricarboxylic transport membrane protein
MDLFNPIIMGLGVALQPENLLFCLLGTVIGMLVGVLPGLGPVATIAILLPLTYSIDPSTAIIMLAGIFYGAQYGGTITSVLLRLPGEASTVVTTFDGYQMARKGRAGAALGISAMGSFIGGTISVFGIVLLAPVLSRAAIQFGPPEYAALALLGVLLVTTLGSGSVSKSLLAALFGLLLATVGRDPFTVSTRFTFGSVELSDGLDFAPIAMGLFGLSEILRSLEERGKNPTVRSKLGRSWPTRTDWITSRFAIMRGTVIGFLLGVLPGGGVTISSMVSYAAEKRISKTPEEFGNGSIKGVAGPETANNAAATSSFIPLLSLGIPANGTMAVLLGALLIQGVSVGPRLMVDNPDVFWGVVASMWIGNGLLLIMSIPLIGVFVRILSVRSSVLLPITAMVTLVGVYTIQNSVFDVLLVILFGLIGYVMKKFGFDPAPLVLSFVLGSMLENSFRQSLSMFNGEIGGFLARPISFTLLLAGVLVVLAPLALRMLKHRAAASRPLDRVDSGGI